MPRGEIPVEQKDLTFFWEDEVKRILAGFGFTEVYNYSMVSKDLLQKVKFPVKEAVKLYNPLNEEMEYMRTTLLPQILQNVADNIKNSPDQKIFELSNVYIDRPNDIPDESLELTGAVVAAEPFRSAKGAAGALLKKLSVFDYRMILIDPKCPLWEKDHCLDIFKGKKFLGQFGLIKKDILEKFGIKKPVALFYFDFKILAECAATVKTYRAIPEFPGVTRDLAVVVDEKVSWQEVRDQVNRVNRLIVKVEYLSTFVDPLLGKYKKSLALRTVFQAPDRTLKSEEVDEVIEKMVSKLEQSFGAKLR